MNSLLDKLIIEMLKRSKTIDLFELSSKLMVVPSIIEKALKRLTKEGFISEHLYNGHKRYKLLKKRLDIVLGYDEQLKIVINEFEQLKSNNGNLNDLLNVLTKLKEAEIDLNKFGLEVFND